MTLSARWTLVAAVAACAVVLTPAPSGAFEAGTLAPTLELVEIDGVMVPFQSGSPLPDFEPQDRETIDLGGLWKKQRRQLNHGYTLSDREENGLALIEVMAGGRHLPGYDDSAWEQHGLPGPEGEMPGDDASPPEGYHDGVWYRNAVQVPADWQGRTNRFVCLGANYVLDLWVNGQWVGVHEGGYTPFSFDVSPYLNYGGENLLALRVDKPFVGLRQDTVPSWPLMDWWSYTGVIQDLYLESAGPVRVVRTDVIPQSYNGDLTVRVVVANDTDRDAEVIADIDAFGADAQSPGYLQDPRASAIVGEPAGLSGQTSEILVVAAGEVRVLTFEVHVQNPMRWTPKEPNLYVLRTDLAVDGEIADTHHTQFGIRTVGTRGDKLTVNGRVAFLPGVARHEQWADTGRTTTWDRIRYDIQIIKDLHSLFLRSGHYPNHVYTYLLTDRLGLATMVEIPVYWFLGWNWKLQDERMIHRQMFREMVLSNYNRPSVILWGTNNECVFLYADDIAAYNRMLKNDINGNYPDGRLVTQSPAAGSAWTAMAPTEIPLDAAGWTLYYGVFYGRNIYEETTDFLREHRVLHPDYPVIATEYGYWSGSDGGESFRQEETFAETWRAFAEAGALDELGNVNASGNLAACSWWCAFDWFTKNGLPEFVAPFHQSMGLIRMDRANWKPVASALSEAYAPYYAFGGLGPEPDDYASDDDTEDEPDDGDDDEGWCGG